MRFAIALALVFSIGADAQVYRRPKDRQRRGQSVALRVLPAGGGQSGLVPLCDAANAESAFTGNWTCINADGTARAGSVTTTEEGSPARQTQAVCPNGPNCGQLSYTLLDGTNDAYATGSQAQANDFTVCALARLDSTATNQMYAAKDDTAAATGFDFQLLNAGAAGFDFDVFKTDGASTTIQSATIVARAWHIVCGDYHFVADGTSIQRLYVDGALKANSSTAVGPPQVKTNPIKFGRRDTASPLYATGAHRGFFYTEKSVYLAASNSDAPFLRMASAVLGGLSGSGGEALTFTRASAAGCEDETGSVVVDLPNNRNCTTRAKVAARPAWTELLLRTSEFINVAWTADASGVSTPSMTANTTDVAAPDGSYSSTKIVFPAVANGQFSRFRQAFTGTVAPYSGGIWLRTLSGTATLYEYISITGTTYVAQCSVTTAWSRCALTTLNLTASAAWNYMLGIDTVSTGQTPITTQPQSAQTVYAWRANLAQTNALPLGGIDASDATVSVAIESASVAKPASVTDTQGCIGLTANLTGDSLGANPMLAAFTANVGGVYYTTGTPTSVNCHDGTNTVTRSGLTSIVGRNVRVILDWSGTTLGCTVDGVRATGTYDGALTGANLFLGSLDGTSRAFNGLLGDVVVGSAPGACQ